MKTRSAEKLLKTDDLYYLKEGEVFVDSESGKRYRVRKTLYPQQFTGGPCGVGEPNDRTLRRVEADIVIPDRMNEYVQRVECHELLAGLTQCLKREGSVLGLRKCQKELALYDECRLAKFNDPWFRQQITDEYIKERAEYRRTGKNATQRRWEEYCNLKKKLGE